MGIEIEPSGEKALKRFSTAAEKNSFSLSRENMRTVKICDFLLYFKFSACFRLRALNLFAHRICTHYNLCVRMHLKLCTNKHVHIFVPKIRCKLLHIYVPRRKMCKIVLSLS